MAVLPGNFVDVIVSVDARVLGDPSKQIAILACRHDLTTGSDSNYRLWVNPGTSGFLLGRVMRSQFLPLAPWAFSAAIKGGNEMNRLELICVGDLIAARINGQIVGSARDGALTSGGVWFGADDDTSTLIGPDVRFDNLELRGPVKRTRG